MLQPAALPTAPSQVFHNVMTLESSLSVTADRLMCDGIEVGCSPSVRLLSLLPSHWLRGNASGPAPAASKSR